MAETQSNSEKKEVDVPHPDAPSKELKAPIIADKPDNLTIKLSDEQFNKQFGFPNNVIVTSKYTILTFLPINLFEQFRHITNCYFLLIIALGSIPEIAPFDVWTSILPLVLIVSLTAVKDGLEDRTRHQQDHHHNSIEVNKLDAARGQLVKTSSADLKVGDVIKLFADDEIPADCIVLKTPEEADGRGNDGTCRMNTSSLDGENAPKVRKALDVTNAMSLQELAKVQAYVKCNKNTKELHGFVGRIEINGETYAIGDENFLFRAAFLANTEHIYAMILFVGKDTTLMLNRNPVPYKFSSFSKMLNRCVVCLLIFNLALCLALALFAFGGVVFVDPFEMLNENSTTKQFFLDLGTWYILFSFMVPISLIVTVEVVKIFEGLFMQHDTASSIWEVSLSPDFEDNVKKQESVQSRTSSNTMPDANSGSSNTVIRMEAVKADRKGLQVRSSALNEELGQVQYIFSDKTGTLTQNKMELSKLSFNMMKYKHDLGTSGEVIKDPAYGNLSEAVERIWTKYITTPEHERKLPIHEPLWHLIVNLMLCSETIYMEDEENEVGRYVSSSPEEVAFTEALDMIGIKFLERRGSDPQICKIMFVANEICENYQEEDFAELQDVTLEFKTHAVLDFKSKRMRMTTVSEDMDGNIIAYSKGADAKLLPSKEMGTPGFVSSGQEELVDQTQKDLDQFAREGSRTLVMTYKRMGKREYETFKSEYDEAAACIGDRSAAVENSFVEVEKEHRLIGACAVEDQMQEHVFGTVQAFQEAKIKVMMLTGDKKETAITIGHLSGMISEDATVVSIDPPKSKPDPQKNTPDQIEQHLIAHLAKEYKRVEAELGALPEDRKAALVIKGEMLDKSITHHSASFGKVFDRVATIVCNRVAPAQKAMAVKWCMKTHEGTALAIGDGANDVSMIQASNVGIGIMGKEGTQAALAADFVIYRFMHLKKLLFVHGRYNYLRTARVVLFQIYKNLACIMPIAWFGAFSGATGLPLFEAGILSMFNVFYTSLPPFLVGVFEKDAPVRALLKYPEAYLDFVKHHPVFNTTIFIRWCADAVVQSVLYYFFAHLIIVGNGNVWDSQGRTAGLFGFGTMLFTWEIVAINAKLVSMTIFWNVFILCAAPIGIAAYCLLWAVYEQLCSYSWDGCGIFTYVMTKPLTWLGGFIFVVLAVLPGVWWDREVRRRDPSLGDILREADALNYIAFPKKRNQKEKIRVSKRSTSAFSLMQPAIEYRPLKEIIQIYKDRGAGR